ncbi:MAG: phosphopantothenoylcysteine decarboxylase [Lentisphaeria bacterium]|nr:phosphopantothenoylcysteine decarboxylase [Lentisphaerota bacterium]MBR2624818.1 phosphopantothenoylcysteine decarboxylase [Lentisphaeria bacterium]
MKSDKLIVLGVTGSIAAYKAADLCSKLAKEFEVQVIMTENACRFVTPVTFRTLSRRPVITTLWEDESQWRPRHVELADEADFFAVVPATANFLAKAAYGIADDALSTFAATFQGKHLYAPAMNPKMWSHFACQENVRILKERGVAFAGPANGNVACGAAGTGRMIEAVEVQEIIKSLL